MFTREQFLSLDFDQKKEVMDWKAQFHQKKAKATSEVKRIKKMGYNSHHKYYYATESDVKEEMRSIMFECGISFTVDLLERKDDEPRQTKNGWMTTTHVKMLFTFTDIETGFFEEFMHDGTAMDSGDKGIYKAYSNTIKYALMDYFLISTGDDVEKDSPEVVGQNQQQQKQQQQPSNSGGSNGGQAPPRDKITAKNIMDAEDRLSALTGSVKMDIRNELKNKFGVLPKYKDMDQQMAQKVLGQLNAWITSYENPQG